LKDTGKQLKLQGAAGSRRVQRCAQVDTGKTPEYSSASLLKLMPQRFSFFVSPSYASYWWWYRTATEEAPGN